MKQKRLGLKKAIALLVMLTIVMAAIPVAAVPEPDPLDGEGTQANPYKISDAADLKNMSSLISLNPTLYGDKHYVLTRDIVLPEPEEGSYANYQPIGDFAGTFDGQGYKIDGLVYDLGPELVSISASAPPFTPFFDTLLSGAEVKNISFSNVQLVSELVSAVATELQEGARLENVTVSGSLFGSEAAGLVIANLGEIINCQNSADISSFDAAGGIAVYNLGSITASGNGGEINAPQIAGGVAAVNFGVISESVNNGDISGLRYTGGIVGGASPFVGVENASLDLSAFTLEGSIADPVAAVVISGCMNTGEIANDSENYLKSNDYEPNVSINYGLGGLVGSAYGTVSINNSFNRGAITGSYDYFQRAGGLVGSADNLTIENSGNEGDITTPYSPAGGLVGYARNLTVLNAYNTGDITINGLNSLRMNDSEIELQAVISALAGGLAGVVEQQYDDLSLTISNSYSSGKYIVSESEIKASYEASANYGNLVGTVRFIEDPFYESNITIENSYWLDQGISDGPIAVEDTLYIQSIEPVEDLTGSLATFADNSGTLTPLADNEIINNQTSLLYALNAWVVSENETAEADYLFWGSLADTNDGYPYFAPEITITLDADGGQASLTEKSGRPGLLYGQDSSGQAELLPTAVRSGFTFAGWYDGKTEDSAMVTDQTVITNSGDHTVYAHWKPFVYIGKDTATGIAVSGLEQNIRIPESDLDGASEISIFIQVKKLDAASGKLNEDAKKKLADQGHLLLGLYDISIFKRIAAADGTYQDMAVPAGDILGKLTVRIPIAADQADKQNLMIAYLDDEGSITYPETTRLTLDGVEYLQFATDHFSHYAVIESDAIPLVDLNPDEMTKTGEQSSAVLPALVIAGLGALLLLKSKMKSTSKG